MPGPLVGPSNPFLFHAGVVLHGISTFMQAVHLRLTVLTWKQWLEFVGGDDGEMCLVSPKGSPNPKIPERRFGVAELPQQRGHSYLLLSLRIENMSFMMPAKRQ